MNQDNSAAEPGDLGNLSKFLASCGVASRRAAAELVKAGSIRVNGETELNPGRHVTATDHVEYRGRVVRPEQNVYHVMLHKPRGYVCTSEDIHAARKALDLIEIPGNPRLFSAGRLDKNSEGLILFSNDGDFVNRLTHPRFQVYKTYDVSLERPLSSRDINSFLNGVCDAGEVLKASAVEQIAPCRYRLILGEGKNREIRRLAEAVHNNVRRLVRIAVGRLELGGLRCGQWRHLNPQDMRLVFESPLS